MRARRREEGNTGGPLRGTLLCLIAIVSCTYPPCAQGSSTLYHWRLDLPAGNAAGDPLVSDVDTTSGKSATGFGDAAYGSPNPFLGTSSAEFDGDGDYLSVADDDTLDLTGLSSGLTLEAYIRPDVIQQAVILRKYERFDDSNHHGYWLDLRAEGEVFFHLGAGETSYLEIGTSTGAIEAGGWHHVAGTWDGTTMRLYIDGVEVNSGSYAGGLVPTANPLGIGAILRDGSTGQYFDGLIDEVRISQGALSPEEFLRGGVPPSAEFDTAESSGSERLTPARLAVCLSNATPDTVSIDYTVTDAGALGNGVDYTLDNGTLTFTPGERVQYIKAVIIDDGVAEEPESFTVTLSSFHNASAGTLIQHTYTIVEGMPEGPVYTNEFGMVFKRIPAGAFTMGTGESEVLDDSITFDGHPAFVHGDYDEHPAHEVTITQPFYMAACEVTNADYERFDPSHAALRGLLEFSKEDDEAVVFVNWEEAQAYCTWMANQTGLPFRLPTEAEWEYACRAGATTAYFTGDTLPESFWKNQKKSWYPNARSTAEDIVPLYVAQTPANPWGLYDMHGNVEEWCADWYGPYLPGAQTDPAGRTDGDFRVSRGGSHSTVPYYLRSANRMGTLPEDKHWLLGLRVALGTPPPAASTAPAEAPLHRRNVLQEVPETIWEGPDPALPYFQTPRETVHIPEDMTGPLYPNSIPNIPGEPGQSNHNPNVAVCRNGDLLLLWDSTVMEQGREMNLAASRLRHGEEVWEDASVFWESPDRNDHAPVLWNDADGTLYFFCALGAAGTRGNLAGILRVSEDNGATWSRARMIHTDRSVHFQPSSSAFRTQDGTLILPSDATAPDGYDEGTYLYRSHDNGETWDPPSARAEGIHGATCELPDGRVLLFGRTADALPQMPENLTEDLGDNWITSPSVFPPIGGGQRGTLIHIQKGVLLHLSFARTDYSMIAADGTVQSCTGLFTAISYDQGASWPAMRLVSDGSGRTMLTTDGGAFTMTNTTAEPRGYTDACQTPNGVVHLFTSSQHYAVNLAWLNAEYDGDGDGDGISDYNEARDLQAETPGIQNPFDANDPDSTGDNRSTGPDGILDGENDWDGDGVLNAEDEDWSEGGVQEGETTEGETAEGETTEGEIQEGEAEGDIPEGEVVEGENAEGEAEGYVPEGEAAEGETTEGEGEQSEGEGQTSEGENTDGELSEGEFDEGEVAEGETEEGEGEQSEGEGQTSEGENTDGELSEGESDEGEVAEGETSGGEGEQSEGEGQTSEGEDTDGELNEDESDEGEVAEGETEEGEGEQSEGEGQTSEGEDTDGELNEDEPDEGEVAEGETEEGEGEQREGEGEITEGEDTDGELNEGEPGEGEEDARLEILQASILAQFDTLDQDADTALTYTEIHARFADFTQQEFEALDTNQDGLLTPTELGENEEVPTGCFGQLRGKSLRDHLGGLFLIGSALILLTVGRRT